jgi:hypothetical protein
VRRRLLAGDAHPEAQRRAHTLDDVLASLSTRGDP